MKIKVTKEQANLLEQVKNLKEDFTCSGCGHTWELEDNEDRYTCHFCGLNNKTGEVVNEAMVVVNSDAPNYPSPITLDTAIKFRKYLMNGITHDGNRYKFEEVLISYLRTSINTTFVYCVVPKEFIPGTGTELKMEDRVKIQLEHKIAKIALNYFSLYCHVVLTFDHLMNDPGEVFLVGDYKKYNTRPFDGKGDFEDGREPIINEEIVRLSNGENNFQSPISLKNANMIRNYILKNGITHDGTRHEFEDVLISYNRSSPSPLFIYLVPHKKFHVDLKEPIADRLRHILKNYVGLSKLLILIFVSADHGEVFLVGDYEKYNRSRYDGKGDFTNPDDKPIINEEASEEHKKRWAAYYVGSSDTLL